MRLRVRFGQAYTLGDLQWCMIHVPDHLRTVRDLANHVSRLLELNLRGGNAEPPQLLLGGFLALHGEELRDVFRDDEVVDVEPSEALGSLTTQLVPAGASPAATPQVAQKRGRAALDGSQGLEGVPPGKQPRRSSGGAPGAGVMAIGWQPPDAVGGSAAPAVAANQALPVATQRSDPPAAPQKAQDADEDEDVDDSDEEDGGDEAGPTALPKAARGGARGASFGGGRGRGKTSSEEAAPQALPPAPATSGTGDNRGIFVGGLPLKVDDATLRAHFQFYGAIEEATVVVNQNTGQSKGYGFVEFKAARSRDKVIADGPTQEIGGKKVEVKPRVSKGPKGKEGGKSGGKTGKGGQKGGKEARKGKKGEKGKNSEPRHVVLEEEEDSSSGEEDEAEAVLASQAAKRAAEASEQEELQRQMAALGLPVAFKAGEKKGADEDDDEEDDEDDDE